MLLFGYLALLASSFGSPTPLLTRMHVDCRPARRRPTVDRVKEGGAVGRRLYFVRPAALLVVRHAARSMDRRRNEAVGVAISPGRLWVFLHF
jgi:hypothetical protein